jgi:hypothetical protein
MITCDLKGGLGNQLFQIAATLGYCMEHSIPFIFPYSNVEGNLPPYWETFFDHLKQYTTSRNNFPDAEPVDVLNVLYTLPKYQEPAFKYNEIPFQENMMLFGEFQSYKYSQKIRRKFSEIFDMSFKQLAIKTEFLHLLDAEHTISLHFRIGDYKNNPEIRPVLPLAYYSNALASVAVPSRALVFFKKEDNDAVDAYLEILRKQFEHITFVKIRDEIPDWQQIIIISCCDANIIANSKFSWWGAYLNGSPNKVVFYPNTWFGSSNVNSVSDLFPPDWIEVPCHKIDY